MKLNFTKEELSAALFDHNVFDFIVEEDSIVRTIPKRDGKILRLKV